MDFFEVMDFAGFDLDRANEIAKRTIEMRKILEAVMEDVGLEDVQSEPVRKGCGGLCGSCHCRRSEHDVGRCIFIIVE